MISCFYDVKIQIMEIEGPRKIKLEDLISNLYEVDKILTYFECEMFLRNYKDWEQGRKASICALKKLQEELSNIKFTSDIGRLISNGASVLGGVGYTIGFGLSVFGDASKRMIGQKMMKYGTAAAMTGGAASLSVATVECVFNARTIADVKKHLEEDKQLTEKLFPFIERSQQLDLVFKKVFDCSIASDTVEDIIIVFKNIEALCEKGKQTYKDISNILSTSFDDFSKAIDLKNMDIDLLRIEKNIRNLSFKVKLLLREFCDNPDVRKIVSKIVNSCARSSLAFEVIKCVIIAKIDMCVIVRSSAFRAVMSVASLYLSQSACNPQMLILHVIKIALDVFGIILTAKDINKKKSIYSEMVEDVITLLSNELIIMNRVYSALNKNK